MRRTRLVCTLIFIFSIAVFLIYSLRNRDVSDRLGPEIIMDAESITVTTGATSADILAGVEAHDKADGDVTSSLMVESLTPFIEKGRRNAYIVAIDSDNHVTRVSREVIYSDYRSPQFAISKPLRFNKGTETILTNITASDLIDGDLTDHVRISEEYRISNNTVGEYPMVFTVANSAGDITSLPVTVTIYDQNEPAPGPTVTMKTGLVNVPAGSGIDVFDYISSVKMDGRTYRAADSEKRLDADGESLYPEDMTTEGSVDFGTPGVYEISVCFNDSEGNKGSERLIIVVY